MSTFKQIIWNLTDFEFLASLSSVDFHNKTCFVKPHYYNTLIGMIKKNVEIGSKRELIIVINYIKTLYKQRLGLVSPHSMNRFFRDEIRVSFRAFQHRLEKFFETNQKPKPSPPTAEQKAQKKRERRRAAKLRRNQRKAEEKRPESVSPLPVDDEIESVVSEPVSENESSDLGLPRTERAASPSDSVATPPPPSEQDDRDEEDIMYDRLCEQIEFPEEFIADVGESSFYEMSSKMLYNIYLDYKNRLATIAAYSSDEE